MNYFVYILKSSINGDIYVGSTGDVKNRLALHNYGNVRSTKACRPWVLLETITFKSRSDAVRMERFLKSGQQKEILRNKYGHVVK